jgi:hypothetical protein
MAITNGYVTLASMKNYLGITDSIDDTLLEEIVESASRSIDRIANRYFYLDATASERTFRTTDAYSLIVDDIGSLTGLVITLDTAGSGTFSTAVTINTDYLMEPLNSASLGRPWTNVTMVGAQLFPYPLNLRPGIKVVAKWGWPTVPDDIAQATLILGADLYKRKDSVGGVLGLSELGAIRMSPLGRDISAMVRAYRRESIA